jgi:hypothetical protein
MSTSPFHRSNNPSMFLNLPSNASPLNFYPHQFYSNALRNHFLSPFLLQPLVPNKPNSLCLSIRNESSSPSQHSSPPIGTPTASSSSTLQGVCASTSNGKPNPSVDVEQGACASLDSSRSKSISCSSRSASDVTDDEGSLDRDSKRRRTRTNFTSVQIDELERAFQDG